MGVLRAVGGRVIPESMQVPVRFWYHRTRGALHAVTTLAAHVRPGSIAVDVGANLGVAAYAFRRRGAVVHAFEPQPVCVRSLRTVPGIVTHEVALSDRNGEATLSLPLVASGAVNIAEATVRPMAEPHVEVHVPTALLDCYDLRGVSVIKIDVEGHEMAVLAGARATLARERPVMLIEIEERHTGRPVLDSIAEIEAMGYRGWFADATGTWHPAATFQAAVHQSTIPGAAGYVNDFLFCPLIA
jgi:FkbM family methyltransferase